MSKFKGIISPQGEDLIAALLDNAITWKNPIMKLFGKRIFKVIISTIDNNLLERIPEEWQNPLEPIIAAAVNKEWEEAALLISKFADEKIDIPFLDEASERLLFDALTSLMLGLILGKVESMRK